MKFEGFGIRIGFRKKNTPSEKAPLPAPQESTELPPTADTLARVSQLSPEQKAKYEVLNQIRQELGTDFRRLPEEQKAFWKEFALTFLETSEHPPLASYALKPETFPSDRFVLKAVTASGMSPFLSFKNYGDRGVAVDGPLGTRHVFIDAPFAYLLLYKKDDDTWETISTISFIPDAKKKILLVDQLQGGNTSRTSASDEARRVRMKFATKPEEILYATAKELAKRSGMRGIGLRKPARNEWRQVRTAAANNRPNPYDAMAEKEGLKGFASAHYFLEPLTQESEGAPNA